METLNEKLPEVENTVKCGQCQKEHKLNSDKVVKIVHRRTGEISYYCKNGFCAIAQQLTTIGF